MVFSKHLYMVILSYILLIIAVAGAGIALIITHTALILGCLFLIISLFFIRALVKQLNKFNAKIRIFLDAMEDKESMILFNEQSADKEMNALSHSLNRINELLATTKSQSRIQENFYYSLLEEVERQAIAAAIRQNDGNLTATAEQLGISRQTLYNKIKRFKL